MVSFDPTPEEEAIREQVHRFAEEDLRACMRDCEDRAIPEGVVRHYNELHLACADLPAEIGGLDLSLTSRLLIEEELAWGDAGIAVALPGPGSASYALSRAPKETLRKWCESTPTNRTALVLGGSMRGTGLRIERRNGASAVSGTLSRVAHGPEAEHVVAAALDGEDLRLLWLRGKPGRFHFQAESDRLGLRALRTYSMTAKDVPLDEEECILSGPVVGQALRDTLPRARLVTAAQAVGVARAATEYATKYALERKAFGKPIAEHQAVAFALAEMAINVDAARNFLWYAAAGLTADRDGSCLVDLACAHVNDVTVEVASSAVQVLGGHGYVQDHPVEKWFRDVRTLATWWRGAKDCLDPEVSAFARPSSRN